MDPFLFRGFRAALRTSGIGFAVAFGLALLDGTGVLRLPQPFRSVIPWVMILAATVGITLLVGALGMPTRDASPPEDELSPEDELEKPAGGPSRQR